MKKGFIRNSIPYIVVFGLLGGFAGVVWITHYPETPWLDKAEKWPLVGGPLADLRSAYLPDSDPRKGRSEREGEAVQVAEAGSREPRPSAEPEEPLTLFIAGDKPAVAPSPPKVPSPNTPASGIRAKADASGSSSPEVEPIWATSVSPPGRVDAKGRTGDLHKVEIAKRDSGSSASSASSGPSNLGHSGRGLSSPQQQVPWLAEEWEWILPGNRVLDAAHSEAELITELTAMAYLPVLMRKGAWAEVIFAGERGWVDTAWKPPFSRKKSRRGILRSGLNLR